MHLSSPSANRIFQLFKEHSLRWVLFFILQRREQAPALRSARKPKIGTPVLGRPRTPQERCPYEENISHILRRCSGLMPSLGGRWLPVKGRRMRDFQNQSPSSVSCADSFPKGKPLFAAGASPRPTGYGGFCGAPGRRALRGVRRRDVVRAPYDRRGISCGSA